MDKCCVFTAFLLVYLVAFVDSKLSYECEKDEKKSKDNMKNVELRLKFADNITADTDRNNHYSCNVKTENSNKKPSNEWKMTCTISSSAENPETTQSNELEKTNTNSSPAENSQTMQSSEKEKPNTNSSPAENSQTMQSSEKEKPNTNSSPAENSQTMQSSEKEKPNTNSSPDSSAKGKKNRKDVEKCYTLTEIILVALICLLMGVLLAALLMVLYMKRTQQGCFSNHVKDVQADSKQQPGPYLQLLTERVVVQKYDPEKPNSTNWKFENEAEETQYQSLNSNQVDNDQQTYDELEVMGSRSDCHGKQPRSSRPDQAGNAEQTDHMTSLQHKNEGIYEYYRDSDLGGHNYFILASDSISQESNARNLGRLETHAEVSDEVRDSNLGTEDEQPDAAHEYFVLEHVENGHHED